MTYAYARVSSANQNLARQIDAFHAANLTDEQIVTEKQSGKDFENRKVWNKLFRKFRKGDLLYIKSLDRLGRNYDEILDMWRRLTKEKEIDIVVLDMPLLDTRTGNGLIGKFISDIVLQILSFVAEQERTMIKQRQMEGIKAAKERGVRFGRPKLVLPENFTEYAEMVLRGEISQNKAALAIGLSAASFKRYRCFYQAEKESKEATA